MRPLFTRFTAHLSAGLADITEEGLTRCFAHTTPIEFALQCTTSEPFHCLCQQTAQVFCAQEKKRKCWSPRKVAGITDFTGGQI